MNRNIVLSAAALAATSLFASAQTNKPADTTRPAQTTIAVKLSVLTADDLIGADVKNPQGEKLGKVEDLVLYSDGTVAYAVLSYGGILGMGDKLFAVPWCLMQASNAAVVAEGNPRTERDNHVMIAVDKEKLKTAPGFDKDKWPKEPNTAMFGDCDRFYAAEKTVSGRPMEASARTAGSFTLRASDLKGENVETPSGDKLGDIKEIVVDPTNARVNYVAVSVGGFLGVGDKLVAVPWSALKVAREDGEDIKLSLATTKEKLEKAPEFYVGEARWVEMSDPVWIGRVYTYYSVRPYWSDGMTEDQRKLDKDKDPLKKN